MFPQSTFTKHFYIALTLACAISTAPAAADTFNIRTNSLALVNNKGKVATYAALGALGCLVAYEAHVYTTWRRQFSNEYAKANKVLDEVTAKGLVRYDVTNSYQYLENYFGPAQEKSYPDPLYSRAEFELCSLNQQICLHGLLLLCIENALDYHESDNEKIARNAFNFPIMEEFLDKINVTLNELEELLQKSKSFQSRYESLGRKIKALEKTELRAIYKHQKTLFDYVYNQKELILAKEQLLKVKRPYYEASPVNRIRFGISHWLHNLYLNFGK